MSRLTSSYWTNRYQQGYTGWDIGEASPALIAYCEGQARESSILIPGAGNAYEWQALKDMGFEHVTVLDYSEIPIQRLRERYPDHAEHFVCADFFEYAGSFDLILEQTFFCALEPKLRPKYVQQVKSLLAKDGALAGVLFNKLFDKQGPPFGGRKNEYERLFSAHLTLEKMEACYNSIQPRDGAELFFKAIHP